MLERDSFVLIFSDGMINSKSMQFLRQLHFLKSFQMSWWPQLMSLPASQVRRGEVRNINWQLRGERFCDGTGLQRCVCIYLYQSPCCYIILVGSLQMQLLTAHIDDLTAEVAAPMDRLVSVALQASRTDGMAKDHLLTQFDKKAGYITDKMEEITYAQCTVLHYWPPSAIILLQFQVQQGNCYHIYCRWQYSNVLKSARFSQQAYTSQHRSSQRAFQWVLLAQPLQSCLSTFSHRQPGISHVGSF